MEDVCGKNWERQSLSDALGLSLDWKTFCPFGLERRVLYKRVGQRSVLGPVGQEGLELRDFSP